VKSTSQHANNAVKVTIDRISPPQVACAIALRNRPCCGTYYLPFREQTDRAGDCVTGTPLRFPSGVNITIFKQGKLVL